MQNTTTHHGNVEQRQQWLIFSAYKQAFFRVRAAGDVADFWQPDPARATRYASAAAAETAIDAMCSSLTRHMTRAVTEHEAAQLAIGPCEEVVK